MGLASIRLTGMVRSGRLAGSCREAYPVCYAPAPLLTLVLVLCSVGERLTACQTLFPSLPLSLPTYLPAYFPTYQPISLPPPFLPPLPPLPTSPPFPP